MPLIKFSPKHKLFMEPKFATKGSACFDLHYCGNEPLVIYPVNPLRDQLLSFFRVKPRPSVVAVPLGFAVELEPDYELQIRPRSGLALKNGITVLNSPGCVDSDFRGEVKAILVNFGSKVFTIEPGMRVCQANAVKLDRYEFTTVEALSATDRGDGGFGSTGK